MPYKPFFGNYIGFQVAENSAIQVDYFKISKLTPLSVNESPDIFFKEPLKINYANSVSEAFKTEEKEITITGQVTDDGGVFDLFVNDKEVVFRSDGEFMAKIPLAPDINLVRIVARDKQMVTSEKVLYIERLISDKFPVEEDNFSAVNFHALLISVGQYQDPAITDLDQPISDASKLREILIKKYSFPEKNVNWLQNPDRESLIVAFDDLGKTLTREDNLLIFYAGHGYWNENLEVGYWMPSDSKISNPANWFANSTIGTT
jgi:hypothetical protein